MALLLSELSYHNTRFYDVLGQSWCGKRDSFSAIVLMQNVVVGGGLIAELNNFLVVGKRDHLEILLRIISRRRGEHITPKSYFLTIIKINIYCACAW